MGYCPAIAAGTGWEVGNRGKLPKNGDDMSALDDPNACANQLAVQLEKQTEICIAIKRLSEQQQTLVADRKEDELLSLLGEKQNLMDRHQALFAKTQQLRDKWEQLKGRASPESQAKAEDAWERLKTVLNEVVALEDASRGMLEEQQSKLSMDIGKVQRGKIANKAYGNSFRTPSAPRFSDRQG